MNREAEAVWAERYLRIVDCVYGRFMDDGEWPSVESVQRTLDQAGEDIDVLDAYALMGQVPSAIGMAPSYLVLPARVLVHLPAAAPLLDAVLVVVNHLVDLYFAPDGAEAVKSTDATVVAGVPDAQVRQRVGQFLTIDYPTPRSGSGCGEDTWWLGVNPTFARRFRHVADINDYLSMQYVILDESYPGRPEVPAHASLAVFVIMPFGPEWSADVYAFITRAAALLEPDHSLKLLRADHIARPGKITNQIVEEIESAVFVVADVTGANPNVMYELGYAQALGKHAVILTQDLAASPFDLQDWRQVPYTTDFDEANEMQIASHMRGALES